MTDSVSQLATNFSSRTLNPQLALVGLLVKLLFHARLRADTCQSFFEFLAQERVFRIVRNRGAAIFHVNGAVIDGFLPRTTAIAARRVRSKPCGETQGFFA